MPWDENNYPNSMKNLTDEARYKAIEIANALLRAGSMDEGLIIATAIKRAKEWVAKRHHITEKQKVSRWR